VNTLGMTAPRCPSDSFSDCSARACAFVTYKSTSFCSLPLDVNSSAFDSVRLQHNKCYEVFACSDNTSFVQKRSHVTMWENQTNECIEYYCGNESGNLIRYTCNNDTHVCVNDSKCVEKDNKQTYIEIEMVDGVHAEMMNTTQELERIRAAIETSGETDGLEIRMIVNKQGFIVRLIVYIDDFATAQKISEAVKECNDEQSKASAIKIEGI